MHEEPRRCPFCGFPLELIWVHGHGECARCHTNVEPCCEGDDAGPVEDPVEGGQPAEDEPPDDDRG